MSNLKNTLTPKDAVRELWARGILKHKLHPVQLKMLESYLKHPKKVTTIASARRLGKCIAEGTEVLTPEGPVNIENLKIGDKVYGFNKDGSTSLTTVLAVEFQGEKEVTELLSNSRILAESTEDHRWAFFSPDTKKYSDSSLKDAPVKRKKIAKVTVQIPGGNVREIHAYALGALLGDGCSKQGSRTTVYISSQDELIPQKVAGIVGTSFHRNSLENYTWNLTHGKFGRGWVGKNTPSVKINYYNEWCKDRYAHEKIIDIDVIKTWDRQSRLELLAGLIDTDGSVGINRNILTIQFGSQSMSLMKAVQYLILSLVQYKISIWKDKRTKYKNGSYYSTSIRNNRFSKQLIKELDPYLILSRKKWKAEYENLNENNTAEKYVGIKLGNKRIARTWDIQVDNETSWYVLANGLVTHNSFFLCVIASEMCLRQPNAIVKYLCPVKKQVKTVVQPIMDEIFKDCPLEMKPEFKYNDYMYVFPNGSQIQLAGTDGGHHESLRGGKADLWIVDEASYCDRLKYIVRSILTPTTLTTGGRGILASTPSEDPTHEFIEHFYTPAEEKGELIKYTIFDNPMITEETLREVISDFPKGKLDPEFRREYLCEIVRSGDLSIIPEFSSEAQEEIVQEVSVPAFYDAYVSMDIGGAGLGAKKKDLTAILFGYYDFKNARLIIQDELIAKGNDLLMDRLAQNIRKKEELLWTNKLSGEFKPPYLRISDSNNPIMLNELLMKQNLLFIPTRKDNKDAAINTLRMMIADRRLFIDPKCVTLIRHLQKGTWSKDKKSFARSGEEGHYDMIDALIYMLRNVQETKNPYPPGFGYTGFADRFAPVAEKVLTAKEKAWVDIFRMRSSLGKKKT